MSDNTETNQTPTPEIPEDDAGRMVENVITMKDFISQKDALKFGAFQPEGTVAWLGTVIGTVLSGQEKRTTRPDGAVLRSFQFNGVFERTLYADGSIKTSRSIYLPSAFSDEMELVFKEASKHGETNVSFACEVGIQAIGRTIPYAYKVKAYGRQSVDLLAAVRGNLPPRLGFRLQQAIARDVEAETVEGLFQTIDNVEPAKASSESAPASPEIGANVELPAATEPAPPAHEGKPKGKGK